MPAFKYTKEYIVHMPDDEWEAMRKIVREAEDLVEPATDVEVCDYLVTLSNAGDHTDVVTEICSQIRMRLVSSGALETDAYWEAYTGRKG
jgi:hypothetical protein